ERSQPGRGSVGGTAKGAYLLVEASAATPQVILIGTGSEVQIVVAAREKPEVEGITSSSVSRRKWWSRPPGRALPACSEPDPGGRRTRPPGIRRRPGDTRKMPVVRAPSGRPSGRRNGASS
ncbi:MAG: transketolase-like TK C-terminal-containing protein, partial [Janthinobacterium lividum]